MTDTAAATTAVLTSLTVSGVLVAVADMHDGKLPPLRFGVGVVVAGLALTTLAEFAPDLARAFAVLLLGSSVFVYGGRAAAVLGAVVNSTPAAAPAGRTYKA